MPADARILAHLSALLAPRRGGTRLSVLDLGAGVGQFGHGLLSLDPGVRCFGADVNSNHDWFRATVMVFERWTPLEGEGCTPLTDGIARTSSFPILPEAPTRDIRREGRATAFFKGGALT